MIKGEKREEKGLEKSFYVGLTQVEVKAVNPTKSQVNKMLGKEDSDSDQEINYMSSDQDGNPRVRMSFWLYDKVLDKYFIHSFNITKKVRLSNDGSKTQYVSNVCQTAWSDTKENLPKWFTTHTDASKNYLADKEYREAYLGEEELVTFLRSWLGKMKWNSVDCNVMVDMDRIFNEDFSELQNLINDLYDTPFVILTGVSTDESDPTKQYQQVFGKAFLPGHYMDYINKGMKFPTEYAKKAFSKFEQTAEGQYGFNRAYFEMSPIKKYDRTADVTQSTVTITPTNSKY